MAALIELKAENFKRLEAVELKPAENGTIVIAGRNGQGKSSLLDAILAALCGKKSIDEIPVREGQNLSTIEVTIGTDPPMQITRTIDREGGTKLRVTQKAGKADAVVKKPQAVLDALVGKVAFDPLVFTRKKRQEQVELLCEVVGVNTAEIDAEIENAEHERTEVNREVKQLEGQLAGMPEVEDVEPVSVSELMKQLEDARHQNEVIERLDAENDSDIQTIEEIKGQISKYEREIKEIQTTIQMKRGLIDRLKMAVGDRQKTLEAAQLVDLEPIREKIATAEEINGKVAANKQRAEVARRLDDAKKRSADFTATVTAKRNKRVELMRSADWPVEGLGYDPELGVTFNGLPFSQCSSAEQLRISTAIGLSQNPELRLMIIRDGSLLDDESLAALHDMAVKHDAQILVERVGTGVPGEIVIEDGTVANAS